MEQMSKAAQEREAAKKMIAAGELKDREIYTAKQVATRLGTDAKTLRKFFRSNHSTVEPVGQGGRYEFDAADMPQIKKEFVSWQKKSAARRTAPHPVMRKQPDPVIDTKGEEIEEPDFLFGEDPGDIEPTEEELMELEDLELDLEG